MQYEEALDLKKIIVTYAELSKMLRNSLNINIMINTTKMGITLNKGSGLTG